MLTIIYKTIGLHATNFVRSLTRRSAEVTLCSFILSAGGSPKKDVQQGRPVGDHTVMRVTVTPPIKEVSVHVYCFEEGAAVDP